ncbi:MAG: imidazole glycerol phosphate synthase subunit HisH [Sinobacteraceae bacterium]|nr:imidazole glycerol phosphate synthase subunit HisH [Nevskiaceae bacterium]
MATVALVDCGASNLGSVRYALERLGVNPLITTDAGTIAAASHVILPGVGAAAPAMRRLRELGLFDALRGLRQPLLGICLGMQLLHEYLAEGDVAGLGLLPGTVEALQPNGGLRVPHIGWNALDIVRENGLLAGIPECNAYVYFVHGYAVPSGDDVLALTEHGERFTALERRGAVCGMQFHPERSGAIGARLLENFLAL